MPRTLVLEMSGRIGSIALAIDGRVIEQEQFSHGLQNAAKVLPIIDRLCRAHGWSPREIEWVAVSIGPGSFTGLRIAVTTAKTLALTSGAKIVAVPTLRVLVENAPADARFAIVALDAKRGQVFTARYERIETRWREVEPAHLDRLKEIVARSPRPVHLIGEGIEFHRDQTDASDSQIIVVDPEHWPARAEVVAAIGFELEQAGEFADAETLTPLYIRLAEAEEKRLASLGKASPEIGPQSQG